MREYRRYVEKSMLQRDRRRALIIAEKQAADQQLFDQSAIAGSQVAPQTTTALEPQPQTAQPEIYTVPAN